MRRALSLSILLWLVGALPALASSSIEDAEGGPPRTPSFALEAAFLHWQDVAKGGDSLQLREAGLALREVLNEYDLGESEPLAAAVLVEMERRLAKGLPGADRIALLAVDLAPSFPPAHWGLVKARFQTSPLAIGGWLEPLGDAFGAYLRSQRHARPLLTNLAIALVASLLAGGFLVFGAALARHLRRFAHDLRHLLVGMPSSLLSGAAILGALVFFALVVGGPLFWLGVASILLAAFLERQERWVLALFFVAAGQLGPSLSWLESRTTWADSPAAVLDAVDARGDFSAVPRVRALLEEGSAPAEALFVLARHEKRSGRIEEAAALYDRALALRGDWPAALLNRGNLHFLAGELEEAAVAYERATELDESLAEAWFGLSRVHYRRVNIAEGQEARERALELRPDLAERYNAGEEEGARAPRHLVDAGLSDADIARIAAPRGVAAAITRWFWGPLVSPEAAPIAGGVLGLLLLLFPLFVKRPSRGCAQCGAPICLRCDRGLEESETCSACVQLASRKRGLDPAVRNRKELEIVRYARRRRLFVRVASFLGVGPFPQGKSFLGFLLLPLLGIGIAGVLGGPFPPLLGGWPLGLRAAFLIPLFLAVALSVWSGRGKEA